MPAVNPITAVPTFVSTEEHRGLVASTPASFKDIPPVLRHREENVSITLDPPLDGFTAQDAAHGTLYVLTR
jgi:nucleotide-sensitive chloride channel 1A